MDYSIKVTFHTSSDASALKFIREHLEMWKDIKIATELMLNNLTDKRETTET